MIGLSNHILQFCCLFCWPAKKYVQLDGWPSYWNKHFRPLLREVCHREEERGSWLKGTHLPTTYLRLAYQAATLEFGLPHWNLSSQGTPTFTNNGNLLGTGKHGHSIGKTAPSDNETYLGTITVRWRMSHCVEMYSQTTCGPYVDTPVWQYDPQRILH